MKNIMKRAFIGLSLIVAAATSVQAQAVDPANPYGFEKKAYKPDGTPWTGPVNIGDIIKYVLSYKPGTTPSGPVTIDDTLSPNQTYAPPTTATDPLWTWGSSPYSTGNHEQYKHPGFGPLSVKIKVGMPLTKLDGDGTKPIPVGNKVYGVYHHSLNVATDHPGVDCWDLATLHKCGGYPKSSTTGAQIATPLEVDTVIRDGKIFWLGFRVTAFNSSGGVASGIPTIGCFDTAGSGGACADTLLDPGLSITNTGNLGGLVEDPSTGKVFAAVKEKLFCRVWSSGAWNNCGGGWLATGNVAITGPVPSSSYYGTVVAVHVEQSAAPSHVYIHAGQNRVQCLDIATAAACGGWPSAGLLSGGSGQANLFSSVPDAGLTGEDGVCLWNINGGNEGCLSKAGALLANTIAPNPPSALVSTFRVPDTGKVFFPRHVSVIGPACYDYATHTYCGAPYTVPVPPPLGMQYGLALDPLDPSRCMLALGDKNVMWRFDYINGLLDCGKPPVWTAEVPDSKLCSTGKPAPKTFTWNTIKVITPGAAGTLTVSQGSSSSTALTVNASSITFPVPAGMTTGPAGLDFGFTPSGASTTEPSEIEIEVFYTPSWDQEICYQAKVDKCGPVFNDAVFKGSYNGTAVSVPKKVEVGVAIGPECAPPQPPSCLKGDAKVTCGKVYGTYDINLNTGGAGGVVPDFVEISMLTPGVSLVPALAQYPVVGGQVHLTVAGATPGQAIQFKIAGTTVGKGSLEGTDLCCNGTITVTIPKDLHCPPPPPKITLKKYCDPVTEAHGDLPKPGSKPKYQAICHIKISTVGNITHPISVSEVLNGSGAVTYLSSTDPWTCAPSIVTAPAPMNCTLPANTMTGPTDTSIIDVKVDFLNIGDAKEALNCAAGEYDHQRLRKFCVEFPVDKKSTTDIKKSCGPLKEVDTAAGVGYASRCKITMTTTGPVSYPLSVAEALSGSGTVTAVSTTPSSAWSCSPNSVTALAQINCLSTGGLNNTASNSTFVYDVTFANSGAAQEAKNCGVLTSTNESPKRSCVGFTVDPPHEPGTQTITKVCQPATEVVGAINHYEAKCQITVTTTGPQSGTLTVGEALTGNGTITSVASTTTPAWACTVSGCNVSGSALNQTSSVSNIDVTVSFGDAGAVTEAQNCARLSVGNTQVGSDACTTFTATQVPPQSDLAISVTKTCDAFTALQSDGPWVGTCHVTVNVTGGPMPPFITIGEALHDTNLSRNPPIMLSGFTSADAWTCPGLGAGIPANALLNCSIAGSSFPASGVSIVDFNVNIPNGVVAGEGQNCASAAAFSAPDTPSSPLIASEQVCVPLPGGPAQPVCGDGVKSGAEQCDDGNTTNGDGCSSTCTKEKVTPDTPVLKCDKATAKLVGTQCRCTIQGMTPISKTACGCAKGTELKNGKCRPIPPPPPKCDAVTTKDRGDTCACRFDNMVQVSPSACRCQKGYDFKPGKGCVKPQPQCKSGTQFNRNRNRCEPICGEGFDYNAKRNVCVPVVAKCPPGTINAKGICIKVPDCQFPEVPVPGTGKCINPFGGGGGNDGGDTCKDPKTGRPIPCPKR